MQVTTPILTAGKKKDTKEIAASSARYNVILLYCDYMIAQNLSLGEAKALSV